MAVTISDVARAAGVSKGAVSYALNGQAGVSEETRRRILTAAKDLGWSPSLRAKSLSSSKAYALGLVVARNPRLLGTDPFFPSFIAGIETTLADRGYSLVLTVAAKQGAEEASYRRLVHEGRVDGVILSDMRTDDARIALLLELGLPAVTLNRPTLASPFPAVCMDDTEGISSAVQHLVDLGHTRIAHVGGSQHYIHGLSRRLAWEATLERNGLPTDMFVEADFGAQQGTAATAQLLERDQRPTAIVYANDIMATAGQSYLQQQGLRIPTDISITGYDNTEFAQYLNPALTSIGSDPLLWGSTAAQVLLNQLEGKHDGEDVILPAPQLIVRGSTAEPSA
ncbi:DNA-binding LacI/PurR family transcriptional regulator [Arthrobacter pigmenti]|uniref:DNA-binding LacI/PurR family transcriptional regulator n=1 Tax=Arthrobacter pigmenti TaxID=271432 RepID=A0A846REZ5_9MICC|nr:LacI family DNA-binding transcriptional regulator [Arthrobacter pigmenti]NJC21633.1 DNA-binding LacI/PurR family transcriptional regulator [Arthrobacter pigmenti]